VISPGPWCSSCRMCPLLTCLAGWTTASAREYAMLWHTSQLFFATRILVRPRTTPRGRCRRRPVSPTSGTLNRRLRWHPMTCSRCLISKSMDNSGVRSKESVSLSSDQGQDLASPHITESIDWTSRVPAESSDEGPGVQLEPSTDNTSFGRRTTILSISLPHVRFFWRKGRGSDCYHALRLRPASASGSLRHRCAARAVRQADQDCEAHAPNLV